jgi:hypothetical protein
MPANMKPRLTIPLLQIEAVTFARQESRRSETGIFGITDGKAIGTYLELKFKKHLQNSFEFEQGNAAKGIDLPALGVDFKTTSIRQPQSSCPFKSARQKIYGLGYSLLVFVYEKTDDHATRTGRLDIRHVIYVLAQYTADFQTTVGIREILGRQGNADDLIAFMTDRHLPVDDIEAANLAAEILGNPPCQGYLTISNALQWRLQYTRVIEKAGAVEGVLRLC